MSDAFSQLTANLRAGLKHIQSPPSTVVFDAQRLNVPGLVSALSLQGIALVHNFVPHAQAVRTGQIVSDYLQQIRSFIADQKTNESDAFIVNFELQRFATFPDIANCPKPVINIRHGQNSGAADAGFVDVFKADALIPDLKPLRKILVAGLPMDVLSHFPSLRHTASSFNLYINEGVTNPRDFHIDDEVHHVKAFVYLTDVLMLKDGPYCYVPGSHQENQIKALNKLYNAVAGRPRTDMSLVDPASAIACLAPAGTLILSFQSGLHRGYPQAPNARRLMLTQLFEPQP
jgi:hypothetical protein